jgi:hypothetical protein
MPVGLFRSEDGWAQVDYGTGATIPIPRSRYEANGYKPDFDKLPSEAEYRAAEEKKDDDAPRPVMIAKIATGLRISNPPA